MEHIIKIDWPRETTTQLPYTKRSDAIRHLDDLRETFERMSGSVSSLMRGDSTVGLEIQDEDTGDLLITYMLVGE